MRDGGDYPLGVFLGAMGAVLWPTLLIPASSCLGVAIGLWVGSGRMGSMDPLLVGVAVLLGWMVSPLHLIAVLLSAIVLIRVVRSESLRSLAAGSLLCLATWGAVTLASGP